MVLRWLIAGGGTGGHLFPGLALAGAARSSGKVAEILFLGAERGIEARVVREAGYNLRTLPMNPLRGVATWASLSAMVGLPSLVLSARSLVSQFAPNLVVGLGGYASFPGVLAAYSLRVPVVLLEQNAKPGLANRLLAHLADSVCVSFPDTVASFPAGQAVYTGNPVRFARATSVRKDHPFSILLFGGSAGAHRLNVELLAALRLLGQRTERFAIVHQSGLDDLESVKEAYRKMSLPARVVAFIDNMAAAYQEADLVICRAGATTVAELAAMGKPAILVPYPFASDQHQRHNAESLVQAGAAVMILEEDLAAEALAREIDEFSRDRERLERMANSAAQLGAPQAAARVLDQCLLIASRRKRNCSGNLI